MGKGKLAKFAEMKTMSNVFEYPFSVIDNVPIGVSSISTTTIPSYWSWAAARENIP